MKKILPLLLLIVACLGAHAQSKTILIEAESFAQKGGWVVDQQFMDEMGSPYLLAHGLGVKVENAVTTVSLEKSGKYRVWVRTKDWVAPWNAEGAPGKFNLVINGSILPEVFGTKYSEWTWQDGGVVDISGTKAKLELQDLTGFEGRCDAILLCENLRFKPVNSLKKLTEFRRKLLGTTKLRNSGNYDLVVVGGGIPGITSSLMAARKGLRVALIQDRPVVGGNNSSETRVWLGGAINVPPYPKLGNIVKELEQEKKAHYGDENKGELYEDDHKLALLQNEKNIDLYMNCRANGVIVKKNHISAVVAENIISGERNQINGTLFADCTGDGVIGYLAGADFEMSDTIMGKCNLWNITLTENETKFPKCPWALDLTDKAFPGRGATAGSYGIKGEKALGGWYWESGFYRDPFRYDEWVRDWNFRAMYGAWDALKNVDNAYRKYKLNWSAYISGKRESRRLTGDIILNDLHLLNSTVFDDGLIATGWDMDVHIPHQDFKNYYPEDPFISHDLHTKYKIPFLLPYRILYSRNINNLFMAGRDVSVTHQALGSVRVMRTGGLMGEVVGIAAYLCKKHKATPRDIYTVYLSNLKDEILNKSVIAPGELNLGSMLKPIPLTAKFINDTSFIWCGTMVKSPTDKKYHLFYSRWPRKFGMAAWVTNSEVAHAVSDSPFGPFKFKDIALPVRGNKYWDGMVTHNPTVHFFNGKYYLYYTGNYGDGKLTSPDLNWSHRNHQRIGVAIADDPDGPWKRFDQPIIDVSRDSTAYDAQMMANPSVTQMPDGRYLMVYKAVARKRPQPFGGPVVHLTAIAEKPEGPFIKQNKPIFTAENVDFPAEDPYVWYDKNCYYAVVKDMKGAFTSAGRSLVLFYSLDGFDWKLAKHPLVSDLNIHWENGTTQKLEALERPQLFFENGKMVALLCAVNETLGHSYNVQIPLKLP